MRVRAYHGAPKRGIRIKQDLSRLFKNFPWSARFACVPESKHLRNPNTKFVKGQISAILSWRKEDADEAFHYTLRRDSWEVVVPELVLESWQVFLQASDRKSRVGFTTYTDLDSSIIQLSDEKALDQYCCPDHNRSQHFLSPKR